MEHLHQIDIKIFAKTGQDVPPIEFVAVLQRWIQQHTLPGVLIDVADYSHIHHGAGVILVAHEQNVSVDYADGRMGLLFHRKEPLDGTFQDRIRLCIKYALMAAMELQNEPEFKGRLEFDPQSLLFLASDRLHAPNDETTTDQAREQLYEVAERIFDGDLFYDIKTADSRDRIIVEVKAAQPQAFETLISQCSGQEVG